MGKKLNISNDCLSDEEAIAWLQEKSSEDINFFKHQLSAILQPCLIIGLIMWVGLAIFFRLVIMLFGHSNFRSAFATMFLSSTVSILTSTVIVETSTRLVGRNGLKCIYCVLQTIDKFEDENLKASSKFKINQTPHFQYHCNDISNPLRVDGMKIILF